MKLYFCAYVKTSRGASAVQPDRVQLFVKVLLHLSALFWGFFFNKAGLFNTPPVVIPPCAHSEWKRWRYFLLWAISPGLSLYSCVLVYKALRYNTDAIMGHFLTATWITEIQKQNPTQQGIFLGEQFSSHALRFIYILISFWTWTHQQVQFFCKTLCQVMCTLLMGESLFVQSTRT